MKTLRIFSTKSDKYLSFFKTEGDLIGIDIKIYFYENLSFAGDKLTYEGKKPFPVFNNNDVVLFRRSSYNKKRQHFWLRLLATIARDAGARVWNENYMTNFPLHSGKLFQAAYFSAFNIPHIPTYRLNRKIKFDDFPMIVKKRYSAFGIGTYIVKNAEELSTIKSQLGIKDDYVIQPFLDLERDIRVVILNHKIKGAIARTVNIKDKNQIGVTVKEVTELTDIEKEIVYKVLNVFDFDIAGLDLFTSKSGKTWLGEINLFPNFDGYNKITGNNLFREILELMNN